MVTHGLKKYATHRRRRQGSLFSAVLYGKEENRYRIKELAEEYEVIKISIYNYTKTDNKIILVADFNRKPDNDENEITNGNTSLTTIRRIWSMVRTLR